jgi:probable rRNA maturation factor
MSDEQSSVLFHYVPRGILRRPLRAFALRVQQDVAGGRPFCCLISGDAELRRLNRKFRRKDFATDVLSFPSGAAGRFLGEVAISFEHAREQAAERRHSLEDEIRILMLHGVLHLMGMDHEADDGRMARAERRWRRALELPEGLIERAGA